MPTAMHTFYLRNFYVHNALARGELSIGGTTIDLGAIDSDCYVVSAENDHIVPWGSAYRTTQLVSGNARFVLSNGGHIAGIVNPPTKKAWFLAADAVHPSASEFRDAAQRTAGSWWNDWTVWSNTRAGDLIDPPRIGSPAHPVLGDGPGEYVHGS
jgi:polyhydroxyalkanoate synthase